MMKYKRVPILVAIIIIILIFAFLYLYVSNINKAKEFSEIPDTPDTFREAFSKSHYRASIGFAFKKIDDWVVKIDTVDELELLLDNGDSVTATFFETDTYEGDDPDFGAFKLSYSDDRNCWIVTQSVSKDNSISTGCKSPDMLVHNIPTFIAPKRWKTYVLALGGDSFIELNIAGSGDVKPLDSILNSISFE